MSAKGARLFMPSYQFREAELCARWGGMWKSMAHAIMNYRPLIEKNCMHVSRVALYWKSWPLLLLPRDELFMPMCCKAGGTFQIIPRRQRTCSLSCQREYVYINLNCLHPVQLAATCIFSTRQFECRGWLYFQYNRLTKSHFLGMKWVDRVYWVLLFSMFLLDRSNCSM
jgi:hypothetical protein